MFRNLTAIVSTLVVAGLLAGRAKATVVVLDTFTNSDGTVGTALGGRIPEDVNLSGDIWHQIGTQPDGVIATDGALKVAHANADDGYRTKVSGSTGNLMIVSTSMRYSTPSPTTTDGIRGVGVGFWSNNASANGFTHFTGLQLGSLALGDPTLTLKLFSDGSVVATAAYSGTRTSASDYHDLSYSVNSATGATSNIVLDGDTYSFGATPFSVANTYYFGYVTTGYFGPERGDFDFVQLQAIPEPTAAALIGLSALTLLAKRRTVRTVR